MVWIWTTRRARSDAAHAAGRPARLLRWPAHRGAAGPVRAAGQKTWCPRYGLDMAQPYESVTVETKDHVAQVTLIGPGKGNAMGPAFWSELPELFADLDADPDARAIATPGPGRNFSYGLDLPAMGGTMAPVLADGALAGPRTQFHSAGPRMQNTISAVAHCPPPTLA